MAAELDKYLGREQSYIKHLFLTQYLQAAAYKILQGRSPIFNFVDAFAGPWRVSDKSYSDASFDQALRTLEAVRADLDKNGVTGLKIRFCFCERQTNAVARLRHYAEQKGQFEIHVFAGSFENRLNEIAAVCSNGFTFTFIDPTGWDIRSEPVLEFLRAQRGEFLLNFMAEHVNRHAGYSKVSASFGRFLADPDWSDDFYALPSEWSNERRVLHMLRQKIRTTGAAKYLPDFPILKPREERVKMRLVLGTHSPSGLEVFRDVQGKVERRAMETRSQLRNAGDQQVSLFTDDEIAAMQQDAAGIGCAAFLKDAEARVVGLLTRASCHELQRHRHRYPRSRPHATNANQKAHERDEAPRRDQFRTPAAQTASATINTHFTGSAHRAPEPMRSRLHQKCVRNLVLPAGALRPRSFVAGCTDSQSCT